MYPRTGLYQGYSSPGQRLLPGFMEHLLFSFSHFIPTIFDLYSCGCFTKVSQAQHLRFVGEDV